MSGCASLKVRARIRGLTIDILQARCDRFDVWRRGWSVLVVWIVVAAACNRTPKERALTVDESWSVETLPADDRPPASATLPPTFGLSDASVQRIAGVLRGPDGPIAGTVHLGIAAEDPTVWLGLDRVVASDGRFDFGELRAGTYTLFGRAPHMSTRVVDVDTRASADPLVIFAWPCTSESSYVAYGKTRLAGAHVYVGGVEVSVTDRAGRYSVCALQEPFALVVHRQNVKGHQ